jgi:hypothetical protein
MSLFCVRLSLLICAALDLDIAFRTQKCLPFVPGPEIRMWAAPDEMHRPPAMLTGQLSSAPKSRAPCLVNIAPPISGGSAIGLSATGSPGQAPPADDVSACAQIRTIFKRAILHLRIGIAGQHLGITCPSARRLVAGRGFDL